mgnify:CR=1 FL=1
MINYIFGIFIIIGIVYSFLTGNVDALNNSLISSGEDAISMIFKMIPLLCLWLGVMKIAEASNLIDKISGFLSKMINPLFPELKQNTPSISYIATNIAMNMLGLGSGATPFGLKAMESMQQENDKKDTASRSMITFLVINTASVTIIPTTVISMRILAGSTSPTIIVPASIITTILSCFLALIFDRIFYHIWSGKYG